MSVVIFIRRVFHLCIKATTMMLIFSDLIFCLYIFSAKRKTPQRISVRIFILFELPFNFAMWEKIFQMTENSRIH